MNSLTKSALLMLGLAIGQLSAQAADLTPLISRQKSIDSARNRLGGPPTKAQMEDLTAQYIEIGEAMFAADDGLTNNEKLAVQCYALQDYAAATGYMVERGMYKEIKTMASGIVAKMWALNDGLPKSTTIKYGNDGHVYITLNQLYRNRRALFNNIMVSMLALEDLEGTVQYGLIYDKFLPVPNASEDSTSYYNKLKNLSDVAYAYYKLNKVQEVKNSAYNVFYFINTYDFTYDKDLRLARSQLRFLDSLFHADAMPYPAFDKGGVLRGMAGRAYLRIMDSKSAFKLYDESVLAGNNSISNVIERLTAAYQCRDREKLRMALEDIHKKRYKGVMSEENDYYVRECEFLMKQL